MHHDRIVICHRNHVGVELEPLESSLLLARLLLAHARPDIRVKDVCLEGRFRHDIRDREVWTGVSRHWYSKASDKSPTTGRLYHHLAILARPNALQQLYFYTKSLCVPIPFSSARESIMTLFDPLLGNGPTRLSVADAAFVRTHGILFSRKSWDQLQDSMNSFKKELDGHIARSAKRWLESGLVGIDKSYGSMLTSTGTTLELL